MDINKQVAELESLVRMVAVAARLKHAYTAEMNVQQKIAEWRQATYHALEAVREAGYNNGYDASYDINREAGK